MSLLLHFDKLLCVGALDALAEQQTEIEFLAKTTHCMYYIN